MRVRPAARIVAFGMGLCAGAAVAQPLPAVLNEPALITPRAADALLLGVALAGRRLVAVGEHGVVILSDDDGRSWRQASFVPASVTLTAVRFGSATSGWAVGHLGIILHSADGGETWQRQLNGVQAAALMRAAADRMPAGEARTAALSGAGQLVKDGADKPFLDVMVRGDEIFAVGAYGLAVLSQDGGRGWTGTTGIADPQGLNIYAIANSGGTVMVAGEQGYLAVEQGGDSFRLVRTPDEGTLFGVTPLPGGAWLGFGLGGTLIRKNAAGSEWMLERTGLSGAITCAVALPDRRTLLASDSGELAIGDASGRDFHSVSIGEHVPITSVLVDGAQLIVTGPTGPRRMALDSLDKRS